MPIPQINEKLTLEQKLKIDYPQQREYINLKARSVPDIIEAWPNLNGIACPSWYVKEGIKKKNLSIENLG